MKEQNSRRKPHRAAIAALMWTLAKRMLTTLQGAAEVPILTSAGFTGGCATSGPPWIAARVGPCQRMGPSVRAAADATEAMRAVTALRSSRPGGRPPSRPSPQWLPPSWHSSVAARPVTRHKLAGTAVAGVFHHTSAHRVSAGARFHVAVVSPSGKSFIQASTLVCVIANLYYQ